MKARRRSTLETLVAPLSAQEFLRRYWTQQSLVQHGPLSRFPEIANEPALANVYDALELVHRNQHAAVSTEAWFQDDHGHQSFAELRPRDCAKLFRAGGITAVINNLNHVLPFLARMMADLERDLGTPMNPTTVNLYASPVGEGSRMHFDSQEVFLLQVHGRKQWKIAPNRQIKHPVSNYYVGGPLTPENRLVCDKLPSRLPAKHQTVVLEPGSVLFLPRGTWHQSHTLEASLALTLTFPSRIWADSVLKLLLRDLMLAKEAWRAPMAGAAGGKAERAQAQRQLDELMRQLRSDFDGMIG